MSNVACCEATSLLEGACRVGLDPWMVRIKVPGRVKIRVSVFEVALK